MKWTTSVDCSNCGGHWWSVKDGTWTCHCGKPMTQAEVDEMHAIADADWDDLVSSLSGLLSRVESKER